MYAGNTLQRIRSSKNLSTVNQEQTDRGSYEPENRYDILVDLWKTQFSTNFSCVCIRLLREKRNCVNEVSEKIHSNMLTDLPLPSSAITTNYWHYTIIQIDIIKTQFFTNKTFSYL